MCYIPKSLRKKYFSLPNLNSNDFVMSHGNRKFSLMHFCKRRGITIAMFQGKVHKDKSEKEQRPIITK
jgi:hypothetical protein